MMLFARFLLVPLALLVSTLVQASTLPQTFSNTYVSSALGFTVTVTHELQQRDDGNKEMRFLAKSWFGSIEEVSVLRLDDETGQVIPLHYRYQRRGLGRNRDA